MKNFSYLFINHRNDVSAKARHYVSGLMQAGNRKNMERMEEVVPDSEYQSLQQFLSDSPWSSQSVMDRVAQSANAQIGNSSDSCFLIDESSFEKKGKKSVGVARQWLGRLGKVDNGQVGVFSSLCDGSYSVLTDARLYLPEEWTKDRERCLEAKIPEEKMFFKTKEELALDIVDHARELGLKYGWVGVDAGYGKGLNFCLELEERNETFLIDIHADQRIFEESPMPYMPTASGKGRKPTRYKTDKKSMRVDKWAQSQPDSFWRKKTLREGTKGKVTYEFIRKQIWV